ncbi:MAG: WYL domain-containing protein [Oscillospiraceae bacterium]|nr:WYL domain-containing protein [Oscillospiraceae bacterium]
MDKDAKRRPLYLARILYEETDEDHSMTTSELILELEDKYGIPAHRQTIKADIQLLQQFGLGIQEIKSSQNKYNVIDRLFDVVEVKLLTDAVVSSRFITEEKSKELTEKLSHLVSEDQRPDLKRNISCVHRIKTRNEKVFLIVDAINTAINDGRKISFYYFHYNEMKKAVLKNDGKPYIITPLHLIWNGDYYYLVGLNEEKQIRTFRVDRIRRRPEILNEAGIRKPRGFNISRYLNSTFHMFDYEHKQVDLICDNDVMDAVIDMFGTRIKRSDNDENSFRITVDVAVSHVFLSWIFGFGGKVRIDGPAEVKEAYADMVRNAAAGLDA